MVDSPRSSADGNGGLGGSGGEKHRSSPPPLPFDSPVKRSKAEVRAEGDAESEKLEEDAPAAAVAGAKEKAPWAKLISQSKQISHVHIFDAEFSVGGSEDCHIHLKDHNASRILCKLWRLEPSGCQLQVTGKKGIVELNGSKISKGGICLLEGGDEVFFCKHAFNFEPFNREQISASATLTPSSSQIFKDGLKQGILGPDAIEFTLEDFPCYLSEHTKRLLLSAAFIHIGKKFIKSLSGMMSSNQRILLCGPSGSEIYQETLIKALAKNFGARLLVIDSLLLPVNGLRLNSFGYQEVEALGVNELVEVIQEESTSSPLIVLVKDAEKALNGRTELHASLGKELPPGVLIIGSHTEKDSPKEKGSSGSVFQARNKDSANSVKHLNNIFPNKISIELPKDEAQLSELNKQLRPDDENLHKTAEEKPEETIGDEESSSDESGHSAWRYMPSISVQGCVATLGIAGERLQACSTFLAGYHGPITHARDFMQSVATYGPNSGLAGETPAALTRIARACGGVGTFLGHVATTVQGVTGMGKMLGAGFPSLARLYGPEVVLEPEPEPEPKPEAASPPAKITISTVDKVEEVIRWTAGSDVGAVEVDIDPDVTPSVAVDIYNEFRTHGSNALALISGGHNMMAKRAMYFTEKSA